VFSLVTGFVGARPLPKERRQAGRQLLIIATDANSHLGNLLVYIVGHARLRPQDGAQGCSKSRSANKKRGTQWWPWYEVATVLPLVSR
jgi:hypothetical protein